MRAIGVAHSAPFTQLNNLLVHSMHQRKDGSLRGCFAEGELCKEYDVVDKQRVLGVVLEGAEIEDSRKASVILNSAGQF